MNRLMTRASFGLFVGVQKTHGMPVCSNDCAKFLFTALDFTIYVGMSEAVFIIVSYFFFLKKFN